MKNIEEQLEILKRGAVEIIPEDELTAKLNRGKPLRIKWGADPSAPDIHLGHTVVLAKLRQFQELGHRVVFIIGDFTARIGDPSGKSETRKALSKEEVDRNAETYKEQVFKVLDRHKTEVVYNSEWLEKMSLMDVFKLSSQYTVARMLERKDFKQRFESQKDISVLEFLYPLLQGYDSVHLKTDLEVGGTDQKFNLLMGRTLQQKYGQEPQVVLTLPLLEGLDGVQKMSKSLGNYIGITEAPSEIFGKTMSISDKLMLRYYELLTDVPLDAVKVMHPRDAKKKLAGILVAKFYGPEKAKWAEEEFESIFKERNIPKEIKLSEIPPWKNKALVPAYKLLVDSKLAESASQARRLIAQRGVRVDGNVVTDEIELIDCSYPRLINVGKLKFLKVIVRI